MNPIGVIASGMWAPLTKVVTTYTTIQQIDSGESGESMLSTVYKEKILKTTQRKLKNKL